jgi:AcrR family transcriptional regulator
MNIGKVGDVAEPVKTRRRYDNARRAEQAEQTRAVILAAARDLFVNQGYARTTIAAVAEQAGTAVDTVYAAVGRKPDLLRALVESAISGRDRPVPPEERDYVQRIQASDDAREQLAIYADAVTAIQARLAPLFLALRDAATTDQDCATLWRTVANRRSGNMRLLAAQLRSTGMLRTDLTDDQVADIIWSTNAAEYWDLLVTQRGWTHKQFRSWVHDLWSRTLLAE